MAAFDVTLRDPGAGSFDVALASGGGAQSVTPPLLASTSALYAPTVAPGAVALVLAALASTSTLPAPTVAPGAVTLDAPLLASTSELYAPTVAAGDVLVPPLLASTSTIYPAGVLPGAVVATLPSLASASALYAPAVATGDVALEAPALASTSALYPPTVALDGGGGVSFPAAFAAWSRRKEITLESTLVPSTQTDIPIVIDRTDADFSTAQTDGRDFRFTAADGETLLAYQIQSWGSPTANRLVAWVQIPSLSSTVDTSIYVYWGNASATDAQDAPAVWADFGAVYLLQENGTGTAGEYDNAASAAGTLNGTGGWDGTGDGDPAAVPTRTAGGPPFGEWHQAFDGGDRIVIPSAPPEAGSATGSIVAWWRCTDDTTLRYLTGGTDEALSIAVLDAESGDDDVFLTAVPRNEAASPIDLYETLTGANLAWLFSSLRVDFGLASNEATSSHGVIGAPSLVNQSASESGSTLYAATRRTIGAQYIADDFYLRYLIGGVSFFAATSQFLSQDYVTTWWNNQRDPAGFSAFGALETNDPPASLAPPLLASTSALYGPTVAPGAVTLALAAALASTSALYPPTTTAGPVNVTAPALDSASALYAPAVAPGAVTLTAPLLASTSAPYAPALAPGGVSLALPALASTSALYAPAVAPGAVSLALPTLASTSALHAPTVAAGDVLALPALASTSALYAPTVAPGAVTLEAPLLASASTLHAPALEAGGVTLAPPFVPTTSTLHPPILAGGGSTAFPGAMSAWARRKALTVDADLVPSTQTNIPIVVDLTDADFATALAGGADFRFTSADGETLIAHDVVSFGTPTSNRLVAWVRVPTLDGTTDTTIYVYWENAEATDASDGAAVWAGWGAAYYLQELGAGTAGEYANAAGASHAGTGGYDGAGDGTLSAVPTRVASTAPFAEYHQAFDGGDRIVIPGSAPEAGSATGSLVVWWRCDDDTTFRHVVEGDVDTLALTVLDGDSGSSSLFQVSGAWDGSAWAEAFDSLPSGDDAWIFSALRVDWGKAGAEFSVSHGVAPAALRNGSATGSGSTLGAMTRRVLGARYIADGFYDRHLIGGIAFLAVTTVELSADFVSTWYANQRDPAAFFAVGVLEEGDTPDFLRPPLLASTSTVYAPTVDGGPVVVTLPLLASASALYAPTVGDAPAQSLDAPLLASTSVLYAPRLAGLIRATRVSGVAPLSVLFTGYESVTLDAGLIPFRDCGYDWDFGDPSAGTWALDGWSKNRHLGPNAAHLYETPGVYTATLTVYYPDGTTDQDSIQITVSDPDVVFAGTNTIVVSTGTDFTGKPTGALEVTTSNITTTIDTHLRSGKRVLLKRGDTFTGSGYIDVRYNGPGILGAWGSGAKPILSNIQINVGHPTAPYLVNDWRLMDLTVTKPGNSWMAGADVCYDNTFVRVTADQGDAGSGITFVSAVPSYFGRDDIWRRLHFYECDSINCTSGNFFIDGVENVFLGCRTEYTTDDANGWAIRCSYAQRCLWAHHRSAFPDEGRGYLKLHAPNWSSSWSVGFNQYSEFNQFFRCEFEMRAGAIVGGGIGSQTSGIADERLRYFIFDSCRWKHPASGPDIFGVYARHVDVRNSIVDVTGSSADASLDVYYHEILPSSLTDPPPSDVRFRHNTWFRNGSGITGTYDPAYAKDNAGPGTPIEHRADNNLVAVSASGGVQWTRLTAANNTVELSPFATTPDFFDPDTLRLASGATARGAGGDLTAPIWFDYEGKLRPATSPDAGAIQFVADGLTAPLLQSTSSIYPPTVEGGAVVLTSPLLETTSALYAPTVAPGPVTLATPLLDSTSTAYPPIVANAGALAVETPFVSSASVAYGPAVEPGPVALELPALASTSATYGPTVALAAGQTVAPPLLASTSALYPPIVALDGTLAVSLPFLGSTEVIYAPAVAPGAVDVAPPALASTSTAYAPVVALAGVQGVVAPALASTSALYAPEVAPGPVDIAPPHLGSGSALYPPTTVPVGFLALPVLASTSTAYGPTVAPGPVTLALPALASTSTAHPPIILETGFISPPLAESASVAFPPLVDGNPPPLPITTRVVQVRARATIEPTPRPRARIVATFGIRRR